MIVDVATLHLRSGDKPLLLRDLQKIVGKDTSAVVLRLKAGLLAGAKKEGRLRCTETRILGGEKEMLNKLNYNPPLSTAFAAPKCFCLHSLPKVLRGSILPRPDAWAGASVLGCRGCSQGSSPCHPQGGLKLAC